MAVRLALGCVVALARSDLRARLHALDLDANGAKAAVAQLVRRIVAEAVLRAYLLRDACKGCAGIAQGGGRKSLAAGGACQVVHLLPCQVVEVAADLHALEWPHAAKIREVGIVQLRRDELAIARQLAARQTQRPKALTILHQPVFDEILRVDLYEITGQTGGQEARSH